MYWKRDVKNDLLKIGFSKKSYNIEVKIEKIVEIVINIPITTVHAGIYF